MIRPVGMGPRHLAQKRSRHMPHYGPPRDATHYINGRYYKRGRHDYWYHWNQEDTEWYRSAQGDDVINREVRAL